MEWLGALLVCLIVGGIFTAIIDRLSYEEDEK